jgi:bile acid-coenzyme A ligase
MRRGEGVPSPYRYLGAEARGMADGWECLGDVGRMDEDGYVYLTDRDTDMILVGGANVYPAEVEAALEEHPGVRTSCVVGLPDEDMGQVVHAVVEVTDGVTDEALLAFCAERLAPYKLPRVLHRTSEPLRDDAGKVRRSAVRQSLLPAP